MITHYLKIAWRNLYKYKNQTIISVVGLTIGVVFFAYGYHWYQYETGYDRFYPDSDRIYQVYGELKSTGKQIENGQIPYIAVNKLEEAFPEIESVAVLYPIYGSSFKHGDRNLGNPEFQFVDEQFFRMFPPKVIAGVLHDNSLINRDELVVTESYARKHFDTVEKALGETLVSGYDKAYVIQAVIANPPTNSIFQKEGYLPDINGRDFYNRTDENVQWRDLYSVSLYVKLHQHTNLKEFRDKLSTFAVDNGYNTDLLLGLSPLSLVKYNIVNSYKRKISYDIKYIRMFILVGILLLFAAFFNYINILLGNTFNRVREINLRRVTGASVSNIYWQLFVEISLFIVVVALLSFCCVEFTRRLFERLFATVVSPSVINWTLLSTVCITAASLYVTTFIFLYRFIKRSAFKEEFPMKSRFVTGRITLVLQLVIGSFAIMSAFILWRQVYFMNHVDWGFDTNNLIQIEMRVRDRKPLMDEIGKLPMVEETLNTVSFTIVPNSEKMGPLSVSGVEWDKKPLDFNPLFQVFEVEENFVEGMKLQIIKGRGIDSEDFNRQQSIGYWESDKVMINEAAWRTMEMDDPIGQKIIIPANWISTEGRGKVEYEIVGVIKDFHAIGLQSEILPLIIKGLIMNGGYFNYVRVTPGTEEKAVKAIKTLIPKFRPDDENEIVVQTMNQLLGDLAKNERSLMNLFTTLAFLCILISIFGIYSMSQREMQRRQKEIAIRKTAGAKANEIMAMFFREYFIVALVSCTIALPLAWLFMERWLENFAYRIDISWWMFFVVVIVVMMIVSVTVLNQVIRAAGRNPAEVVKSE